MLDELFGVENFIAQIAFTTTTSEKTNRIAGICDYLVWYGKKQEKLKFNPLYTEKEIGGVGGSKYRSFIRSNGKVIPVRSLSDVDRDAGRVRSEEHTSELQLLMRISSLVLCSINKIRSIQHNSIIPQQD